MIQRDVDAGVLPSMGGLVAIRHAVDALARNSGLLEFSNDLGRARHAANAGQTQARGGRAAQNLLPAAQQRIARLGETVEAPESNNTGFACRQRARFRNFTKGPKAPLSIR